MKKKTEVKETSSTLKWINDAFAIDGVNNYSDECTFFNLHVHSGVGDITIYGCRVISGAKGDFISFPSRKGDGNKYYNIAYINLTEDVKQSIIDAVSEMI